LRKQRQGPDELLSVVVYNPLIAENINKTPGSPFPRDLIYFRQHVYTLRNNALKDDRLDAAALYIVEEVFRLRMKFGVISNEVPDDDIGIRQDFFVSFHELPPSMPCLSFSSCLPRLLHS